MPLSAVLLVLASTVFTPDGIPASIGGSDPEVVIALAYLFVGIVLVPAAVVDPPGEVLGWVLASSVSQGLYMGLLGSAYRAGSPLGWPIRSARHGAITDRAPEDGCCWTRPPRWPQWSV
ncbi:MAG: hypothetical protein Ct9H300mP12_04420 [Acidimicrobiales bacterium]|nr:MAG: hypothetical protein Ct9H300mP12_04420 [Acidimicrobiales bacterium]